MHVVLFGGANGYRNIGDQAMLLETVRRLQSRLGSPRITVLTARPETTILPPGCELVRLTIEDLGPTLVQKVVSNSHLLQKYYRRTVCDLLGRSGRRGRPIKISQNAHDLWELIQSADVVINYGSGGMNDIFGEGAIVVWSLLYRWCALSRTPFFVTGQGVGPLRNTYFRSLLRQTLPAAQGISVRDGEGAQAILRQIGIPEALIRITFDDAVSLPSASREEVDAALQAEGVPRDGVLVGIHLRATDYTCDRGESWARRMGELTSRLAEVLDAQVVAIPMCYNPSEDDREAARVVARYARPGSLKLIEGVYRPELLKGLCAAMTLDVGFSYHFVLFGLTSGVPTLPLFTNHYYRLKMTGVMKQLGITDWHPVHLVDDNTDDVIQAAKGLLRMSSCIGPKLTSATARCVERVEVFFDDMLERSLKQAPLSPACREDCRV